MRKLLSAAVLFATLSAPLFGEVRVGGLITPKSVSETSGPLGQALFVSIGSQASRVEFFSNLWFFERSNEAEGLRHVENSLTFLLRYRRTFVADKVNPSLTFGVGYKRDVLEDQQIIFGYPAGIRFVDDGALGTLGAGVEYRLHRRIMLGVDAGLWGLIRETQNTNWEFGIQFPMITAAYSFF